ncbi:rod shape-determining protein RodA [Agarivorans sp. Toyoura001]|uniref:DUF4399 domain-containing protein n=1 Tax=Agarivorans sp. Toyoura001 TaxID=2283141 RepID=UPI0010D714E4|nr:DUF4399 domain-containing protein [Agarivorans sp. Toyoura001]GDY25020.1 rod shape-determining protein RodA [Agarivorans sp. Toyoura001]
MRGLRKLLTMGMLLSASVGMVALPSAAVTKAPEGASVYIISPKDGEVLSSPLTVAFGLKGMGVAPAGVDRENTGHHHLLIDVKQLPNLEMPVPADAQHVHFGGGQTEVTIELMPGEHSLQLLLGDMHHIPHQPPILSEKITITVE